MIEPAVRHGSVLALEREGQSHYTTPLLRMKNWFTFALIGCSDPRSLDLPDDPPELYVDRGGGAEAR